MATSGIPTANILKPGVITISGGATQPLISDLQILTPQYYNRYVEKYGPEMYDYFFQWLATFNGMEKVNNQNFFWFENRGKNQLGITNLVQVTNPSAGATVTVNIPASELYNSTYSPLRVGETVYVASSNIEGEIITVPAIDQCTIRPKIATQAFTSAGSTNLLAGEILIFGGITDAGEASGASDSQTHLDTKYDNNIITIRDIFQATDLAELSEVYYNTGVTGPDMAGAQQAGTSYFTYKALKKTEARFINSIESKMMRGNVVTNSGLINSPASGGSEGFIPKISADGETVNYTAGTLDISKLHEITRVMKVNGCAKDNVWLMDIFQRSDFSDSIFKEYPAGAYVWGQGSNSQEASVAYGTQNLLIDGFMFRCKEYSPWNTEVQIGLTPNDDYFRNFGVISPMGSVPDSKTYTPMKNITMMYQEPQKGGTIGNAIRVWSYGGGSLNATDGTLRDNVAFVTYRGIRVAAANQFITVAA